MAFDREEFLAWLPLHNVVSAASDYPPSLVLVEARYHWDLNQVLPAGMAGIDTQLTSDINALNPATDEAEMHRLRNWRSAVRKYNAYVLDRDS